MKETFRDWLGRNTRIPGLLACGVRLPDRDCINLSDSEAFPALRLDQVWHVLAEATSTLAQHRINATRLRWTYEDADLHFVTRGDGVCLGLFTAANLDAEATRSVEKMVDDFLALTVKL